MTMISIPARPSTRSWAERARSLPIDRRSLIAGLLALLALRLALAVWLPFVDTTEARYAEIARKMVETGDWITPQFDYGVPFWGKPPLHTWASALGMKLFGVTPFGARIFILAAAVGVLGLVFAWARREADELTGLVAAAICASSILFFGASAFVMTDMVMVLGTTLSMAGFYLATETRPGDRLWGHLAFVGLAVGMLAKGPTAVVLTGIPVLLWVLTGWRWRSLRQLPWLTGTLLALVLTVPWYVAAELKTPGFLHYFLVGEHLNRFLVPGWTGDLYGSAHIEPKGRIWLHALGVFLPWTVLLAALLLRPGRLQPLVRPPQRSLTLYLALWTLSPMILFTAASNILPAYVLPAVPAFAILLARAVTGALDRSAAWIRPSFWACMGLSLALFTGLALVAGLSPQSLGLRTTRDLVAAIERAAPEAQIAVYPGRLYSAEFYSQGRAKTVTETGALAALATNDRRDAVIVSADHLAPAQAALGPGFTEIARYRTQVALVEEAR